MNETQAYKETNKKGKIDENLAVLKKELAELRQGISAAQNNLLGGIPEMEGKNEKSSMPQGWLEATNRGIEEAIQSVREMLIKISGINSEIN